MPRLEADLDVSCKAGNGPEPACFKAPDSRHSVVATCRGYRRKPFFFMNGRFSLGSGATAQDRIIEHVEV
jgi:hypothetical protein